MAAPTESANLSDKTELAAAPASGDTLYILDVSEAVATNRPKRITFANLSANLQPLDAGLTDIAALAVTDGNIIVGNGANWVAESGATARASLGLTIGTHVASFAGSQQTLAQSGASVSCDGTTNENILGTYTLPAGTMGANDIIEIDSLWTYTNSANNKLVFHRFGGTDFLAPTLTTSARSQLKCIIRAANSVSAQIGHVPTVVTPYGSSGVSAVSGTVNTANNVTISIVGQKASAGETLTLLGYSIILRRAP